MEVVVILIIAGSICFSVYVVYRLDKIAHTMNNNATQLERHINRLNIIVAKLLQAKKYDNSN